MIKRPIKFRGNCVKSGEWFYGSLAYFPDSQTAHIIPCGSCKGNDVICDFVEVCLDTVGQFTGLHDRVGNEIYEGDIIEYCSGCDSFGSVWQTVRIEYRVAEGGYVGINQYRQTRDGREIVQSITRCLNKCIVIGNIHDKKGDEL